MDDNSLKIRHKKVWDTCRLMVVVVTLIMVFNLYRSDGDFVPVLCIWLVFVVPLSIMGLAFRP